MTAEPEPSRAAEPQEQSSRGPRSGYITVLAIFAGVAILLIYGYLERPGWVGSSGKQFWDYLDLLIVPAALALGVYWLNRRQTERDQQAEDAQQERALAVESQRAQDEALQAYLDQMSQLLIEHPLRQASPSDNLSTVARARTLAVLTRVDGTRKRTVLQFLYESELITKDRLIINLRESDLGEADLRRANLGGAILHEANLSEAILSHASLILADLSKANLRDADLSRANLRDADLSETNLSATNLKGAILHEANLRDADLRDADLSAAILSGADLRSANLSGSYLFFADLSGARLSGAYLPDTNLRKANLSGAILSGDILPSETNWSGDDLMLGGANLSGADLSDANLSGAILGGEYATYRAILLGADLSGADLSGARRWTEEQLEQAKSLEGATMPDGQTLQSDDNPDGPTFEEWLKSQSREEGQPEQAP